MMTDDNLTRDLPDPESADRFLRQLLEQKPAQFKKLQKKTGLLSDILTLVAYSPLIAATLLQNPEYIWWLERKRGEHSVRTRDDLLESLARFSLTNSQVPHNVLLARFRRRELTRIYLADIRRLRTIAEITEGISNLADAILENALRLSDQELRNRFGAPQEIDEKGRSRAAAFGIVSLGKLGSRELNYSSDIDLLFLYSNEGTTTSTGTREPITNREYFAKLAQAVSLAVGAQTGEGAAYRVDLRLRPHGRVGPLAMTVGDAVKYYATEARDWERQVLIRSRASAGDAALFRRFASSVEPAVFLSGRSREKALAAVRRSKHKIDVQNRGGRSYDVKLGRGGIREIEFISQALQLAYGGDDRWLRGAHTLVSLSRLADRGVIKEDELAELYGAYDFLRRLEHVLQMENGLQTHAVPDEPSRRLVTARRMSFTSVEAFDAELSRQTDGVRRVFDRVFSTSVGSPAAADTPKASGRTGSETRRTEVDAGPFAGLPPEISASVKKSDVTARIGSKQLSILSAAAAVSPRIAATVSAAPRLINELPQGGGLALERDYTELLARAIESRSDFGTQLACLRKAWSRLHLEIMILDAAGEISAASSKLMQTRLAEASIEAALRMAANEMSDRAKAAVDEIPLALLGLGKLGSAGIDYDSDLDLIIVSGRDGDQKFGVPPAEFYARTVDLFVTALSSVTRDGSLYRIDLRLRPHGRGGPIVIAADAFAEYAAEQAAIWELLAFVKLRSAGGDKQVGDYAEASVRRAVHKRALAAGSRALADETLRVRRRLELERSGTRNSRDIDIKYGRGGMLDIYFAVRYLQLRDNVPDSVDDRSTGGTLRRLHDRNSLSARDFDELLAGYEFLSSLDHEIRLTVGRTTRLPHPNHPSLSVIATRTGLGSTDELAIALNTHLVNIRNAFDRIVVG